MGADAARRSEATMLRVLGIAGSLRRASLNHGLLTAAGEAMPVGATLEIATIAGIPLYNGDDEAADGLPDVVTALKDAIAAADGLLIATPEYNNSMPGVLKNAIDWLSRPASDIPRVFGDKPVAVIGASPGGFGTLSAQEAWLPVLRLLGTRPWFGSKLMVARAGAVFDRDGRLTDPATRERLGAYLAGFVAAVERERGGSAG
jgi:chromate reductase, NAD(P)H dehydrogenase (quinone)